MKTYKVLWSFEAKIRLMDTYKYISSNLQNSVAARNLYNKLLYETSKLKYFPARHPDLSYYGKINKSYRMLRVDKFIIIYKINFKMSKVFILNIFHSNQNYLNLI